MERQQDGWLCEKRRGEALSCPCCWLASAHSTQLLYAQAWKSVNGGQISTTRFSFWLSPFFSSFFKGFYSFPPLVTLVSSLVPHRAKQWVLEEDLN